MGGTLTVWLAERHPEIAGLVLVNPAIEPPAESFREMLRGILDSGSSVMQRSGTTSPTPTRPSWPTTPRPCRAFCRSARPTTRSPQPSARSERPVLLMNSPQDHVVPPSSSDILAAGVSGPVERVTLERSYHVATLDYDKDDIERRARRVRQEGHRA